jgi:tetratricopeptide (TPR) repeat protein
MNRFDGGETRWPEIFPARTAARISVLAGWTGCGVAIGVLAVLLVAVPSAAQEDVGQPDLDAAIDAKLDATSYDDLGRVVDLCRRARQKGLAEDSARFADELEASSLVLRAGMLVEGVFEGDEPGQQRLRMRAAALRDLNAAIAIDDQIPSAQLMLARLEGLPMGDHDRALEAAEKAIRLAGEDRLLEAQARLVRGSLQEDDARKRADFDAAVELAPRDGEVRRTRGLHRLLKEDFKGAEEDLAIAIEEEPDNASLHEALGIALMMDERLDEALAAFDEAIAIDPDAAGAFLQRARILAVKGDRDEALDALHRVIEIEPDSAVPLVLRARIHQQSGDTQAALADLKLVLDEEPEQPAALELRGLIAADAGDYAAAIGDFRRLATLAPDDALIAGQLGMLHLAAKQPREAIRRFSRALELDEKQFLSRRGRSDASISIGDHRAAIADLEQALAIDPENSGVLNNLAWILATSPVDEIRDGKRAIALAQKACELSEWKEAHIISTLAAAHAETGDFDQACSVSRKAVEAGGESDEIKAQLEQELASYQEKKPWREQQQVAEAVLEEADGSAEEGPQPDAGAGSPTTDAIPSKQKPASPPSTEAGGPRPPRRPFQEATPAP